MNTPSVWNFCSNFLRGRALQKKKKKKRIHFLVLESELRFFAKIIIFYFKRKCQWTLPPSEISAAISLGVEHCKKNKIQKRIHFLVLESELRFFAKIIIFYFKRKCQWTLPPSEISAAISLGVEHCKKNKKVNKISAHWFPCFSVRA